jgi:TolB protein
MKIWTAACVVGCGLMAASALAQPPGVGGGPKGPPLNWRELESPLLKNQRQLTPEQIYLKAGEAYFSPDSTWVVFQATARPSAGVEPEPFYGMYVAELAKDLEGTAVSLQRMSRISPVGSANTCGWFHPTKPDMVLYGSTRVRPSDEQKSGFQVGTRRYVWMFPEEMEIVEQSVFRTDAPGPGEDPDRRRIRLSFSEPRTVFEQPRYDAECSWDATGRFLLYTHVEAAKEGGSPKPDGNLYIYDVKTKKHHPIVVAPGYDGGPFFSPDGRSIVYRSDRRGDDKLQIFVADLKFEKGADGVEVPVGIEKEYALTDNEHVNWAPFWHPSGKFILYGSSELGHSNYELIAIESDMAKIRAGVAPADLRHVRVTHADGADILPAFSPDGKWLMWTSQRGPKVEGEERPSSQLWIAEWVAGNPFEVGGADAGSGAKPTAGR